MWYFRALHHRVSVSLRKYADSNSSVLDGGCGTGGLIKYLLKVFPDYKFSGVDISEYAAKATEAKTSVRPIVCSIDQIPLPKESVDVYISADVLSQVGECSNALREAFRLLRSNGILIINVSAIPWLRSYHDDTNSIKHRFTKKELIKKLINEGFIIEKATYIYFIIFPLILIRRKILPPPAERTDVHPINTIIDKILEKIAQLETLLVFDFGLILPIGSTAFVIARKAR